MPLKIFKYESQPAPYWSWRSKLVQYFMRRGRKDYFLYINTGLTSKGAFTFIISGNDGEIVSACNMSQDSLNNFIIYLQEVQAKAKLLE